MVGLIVFSSIIFVVVFLFINYIIAKSFEEIAFDKGYDSDAHAFAMCFWLGIIGYIYVAAMPTLDEEAIAKRKKRIEAIKDSVLSQNTSTAEKHTDSAASSAEGCKDESTVEATSIDVDKEAAYAEAKTKMQRGSGYCNARFYKEAIEILSTIEDYKDSKALIEICNAKIDALTKS